MNIPQLVVRIAGLVMIVLGALIWTGNFAGLVPIHMLVGIVLVLALWFLAYQSLRAGVSRGLVVLAVVVGLALPIFGANQQQVLPGDGHVVVQVAHLALGLVAIGLGEALASAVRKSAPDAAR
jgi:glucose dehydrogenase